MPRSGLIAKECAWLPGVAIVLNTSTFMAHAGAVHDYLCGVILRWRDTTNWGNRQGRIGVTSAHLLLSTRSARASVLTAS